MYEYIIQNRYDIYIHDYDSRIDPEKSITKLKVWNLKCKPLDFHLTRIIYRISNYIAQDLKVIFKVKN